VMITRGTVKFRRPQYPHYKNQHSRTVEKNLV
jgi:hypothetical protein